MEKGEPQYFDIIGSSAIEKRKAVNVETPNDVIPIKKDYKVEIEVQAGMGYTKEGKKAAAKELGDYMVQIAQLGLIPPQVVKIFIENLFKEFEFGATSEIMEAMEQGSQDPGLNEAQMQQMKLAVLEVSDKLE